MQWVKILSGKEEALKRIKPGTTQLVVVHQQRICLARVEDDFFAVEDKCSHNGESLSKGNINYLGEVICPWHGYRFNLQTGRESGERSRDLNTYAIKSDESGFYVGL
ncbi:MAG TPA: Rieske 2Fe-2S domain-containing protein [Cyclobacteriaceae bacterium]|nr:Rieske 2Fe-2S domain-containing protein [Cyclobacteriaceae bacterium]HRW99124.1 Rieske 2Fe-2S domain-containing protein [Cyclobacteriaceae bacterium]